MREISDADHESLREAVGLVGSPLVLTRAATVEVLHGLIDDRYSRESIQAWASFMRRGYIGRPVGNGALTPLDIGFEAAWDEKLADVIARLDEIGDSIDGEVSASEALQLSRLLGEE